MQSEIERLNSEVSLESSKLTAFGDELAAVEPAKLHKQHTSLGALKQRMHKKSGSSEHKVEVCVCMLLRQV